MKLVAAAKLRRAQERILAARPYAQQDGRAARQPRERHRATTAHPLLERREGPRASGSSSSPPTRACAAPSTPTSSAASLELRARVERGRGDAGRGGPEGPRLLPPPGVDDQARHARLLGSAGLLATPGARRRVHAAVPRRRGGRGRTSSTTSSARWPCSAGARQQLLPIQARRARRKRPRARRRRTTSTSRAPRPSSAIAAAAPRDARRSTAR